MFNACAHYQVRPISLTALTRMQAEHTLDSPCINGARANASAWSEAQLVSAASCFNPELARAKAALHLAQVNGDLAKQYPGLALVLSAEYARKAPESSKWLRALGLDLPLDFGARRAVRLQASAQTHVLSALEYGLAQRAVANQIGLSVDAIGAANVEQALLHERANQGLDWLTFVDQRILEGQAARTERLKPQQDLLLTQAALLHAQAAERGARSQLASALGLPLAQVLDLTLAAERIGNPRPLTPDARQNFKLRQAALLARPELLRALGQYQLAELALRLEFAKQYPELRLSPGYIWERGLVKLPLALSAMLPPLDGNRGAIAAAEAARALAARELALVQVNISTEIDLAFANRDAALAARALATQQVALAKSELSAAQAAFDAGELDQLGRLSAELHVNDVSLAAHALDVQLQLSERALATALALSPTIAPAIAPATESFMDTQ